ncbi:MAG: response regulator transcription factor [Planctomycetota bacterium]|jgi:two-component system alkaline phosphatase synthesis response regulator PhoP|nr:response regulator transcription factor [Planctomycetota bacterium]
MSAHLLLVEDEVRLARNLVLNLEAEGYTVTHAATCAEARTAIGPDIDLVVLDLTLPDGDGIELAEQLRDAGTLVPICMLTARSGSEDVVAGLAAGADDYVGKPFDLDVLLGRIAALLRRASYPARIGGDELAFGHNMVNLSSGQCTTAKGERTLTALELRLLRYFVKQADQPVSRDDLLREVWDIAEPDRVRTRTIDTFLGRLRKYFEDDPGKPRHFRTEHGTGYRFLPKG